MFNTMLSALFTDGLWLLIAAGWILLITIGLEVDKPLSGGIPGHVSPDDEHQELVREGFWGRGGVVGSWVVFCLISLTLPVILYWIFSIEK